jgi:hypothetical protein
MSSSVTQPSFSPSGSGIIANALGYDATGKVVVQGAAAASTAQLKGDGIQFPAFGPTATLGGAGVLTGAYNYSATYTTALGETSAWLGVVPLTAAAQSINLTNIPVGPAGVLTRKIYRTKSGSDPHDLYFLTEIMDNTTTTFADNIPDTSLGAPVDNLSSNTGVLSDGTQIIARTNGQATVFGFGAAAVNRGYACTAFGAYSQQNLTSGRRNSSFGLYSLQNVTVGYQNTTIGTHAGNGVTTGTDNTLIGYATGGTAGITVGSANTLVGSSSGASTVIISGNGNVGVGAFGYSALTSTISYNSALGSYAGKYAGTNFNLWIDACTDRGSLLAAQTKGLIWGLGHQTVVENQVLDFNAKTRAGVKTTVALLGAAVVADVGRRAVITDSTVAFVAANIGAAVAGGGAHTVPVICVTTGTGTTYAWAIG